MAINTGVGSITIEHRTEHGLSRIYATVEGLPHLTGQLTTTTGGHSYVIRDYSNGGKNTHPGCRVDNSKTESELLAQMVDEMLTHLD